MENEKIDGLIYEKYTNKNDVNLYVNFDYVENYDESNDKNRYAVMLRFKQKDHIIWSWIVVDRSFKNKQDVIDYLMINTETQDTMYSITMKTLTV